MDAVLAEKPETFGRLLNGMLNPVVERARARGRGRDTRKNLANNQRNKNRNTVRKLKNFYNKITNRKEEIEARKAWIERFGKVLEGDSPVAAAAPLAAAPAAPAAPAIVKLTPLQPMGIPKLAPPTAQPAAVRRKSLAAVLAVPVAPVAPAPKHVAPAPKPVAPAPKPVAPAALVAPAAPAVAEPAKPLSPGRFPTLYSKSKTGKTQVWSIRVKRGEFEKATITVTYGYEGGKMQVNEKVVERGKAGRTAHQQALLEATADWKKKKDSGYAEALGNAQVPRAAGEAAEESAAGKALLPMLAHDYHKQGKKIVFPAYVQAKLDGVRSIYNNGVLTTRMGKPFTGLEHILKELEPAMAKPEGKGLVLDGEVYSDTLSFQQFVGLVRKKKFTDADRAQLQHVKLWVYDCVAAGPFSERLARLRAFFAKNKFAHIQLLPTEEAASEADLKGFHDKYVAAGYEGLIVRNKAGPYELATRSYHLQKYKEFEDAEFEVVGAEEGEGQEKGLVIWVCKTEGAAGKQFRVRPRGTHEERAELWKHRAEYMGKMLTVRYQELTADGIPRFPVGLAFRDYE